MIKTTLKQKRKLKCNLSREMHFTFNECYAEALPLLFLGHCSVSLRKELNTSYLYLVSNKQLLKITKNHLLITVGFVQGAFSEVA